MWPWRVKMPIPNLLMLVLVLMLMLRNVLATVCCRFGSWSLAKSLFALFFLRAWDQMGQKGQYLAKYANFGPNLAVFGPKIHFLEWVKFWYPQTREPMRHLFRVENVDRLGSNWSLWTKMCNFDPNIGIFGAKSHLFCFGIAIFVNTAYHQYNREYNFHIRTTPKKFCFRAMGHFPGLTTVLGHFRLFPLRYYKYP